MRWVTLTLLLALTGLLPKAGVQQRFCNASLQFLINGESCSSCQDSPDCGCGDSTKDPATSPCLTAAKILPDCLEPALTNLSAHPIVVAMPPSCETLVEINFTEAQSHATHDRAPPQLRRLFLVHQRLLI